jgi:Zn-dependent alcohol dehydrogenase
VPNFGQPFSIEHGRALMALDVIGIKVGRSDPHRMIPRLAQLVATGQLPMQHYTSAFPFAQAAEALAAAEQGEVAKAVLVMP